MDSVEVGSWQMKQMASSAEPTSVPFVRVKEIAPYLADVLQIHEGNNNTWESDGFNNELWIKIGVSEPGII